MALPTKKRAAFFVIAGTLLYFLLSYHIVIIDQSARLLKKSTFTLEYTFFSLKGKSNRTILRVDILRRDGIGSLLKEEGLMSEEEETQILDSLTIEPE